MATLKISDLSVGDWVALESVDLKIKHGDIATAFVEEVRKPICVQSILGEVKLVFARTYHLEGYGTICAKEEHLRPIPITAEILEKNGFEEDGGVWHNSETRMEFERYEDGWCRTVNCGEYSVYFIKYVHQLQQALRLAGVDKEIVFP